MIKYDIIDLQEIAASVIELLTFDKLQLLQVIRVVIIAECDNNGFDYIDNYEFWWEVFDLNADILVYEHRRGLVND